ncbi:hypothetical protein [Nocardioides litoris]|uniref:hypothetical protein n=1 Tax=Nocardioides litoris TaxID=1926648 RepID=UPI001120E9D1|nr:hypothetical protein [Nocardioides litoris]
MVTRGPLPRAVYWRRRAVLAGTAVLLLVATVDLVGGDDGPPPAAETAARTGAEPSAPASTPSDPLVGPTAGEQGRGGRNGGNGGNGKGRGARPQPTAPTTPAAPAPPAPSGTCDDADVLVTPVMSSAEAGRPVLVTLSLRTRTALACTWQIDREHLAYTITSDGEDVWSSSECPAQVPSDPVVLRRDFITTYRLAWNGRESSRECPSGMDRAPAGTYEVQAAAIGGEPSEVVPFTLTEPVEPERLGPALPKGAGAGRG